jgi:hypothetical protein
MSDYTSHQIEYALEIVADDFPPAGIKAFLIGGLAVNQYGYSRNTLDVDFMVSEKDQGTVYEVMVRRGYLNRRVMENVVFYHHESGGFRVDFLSVDAGTHTRLSRRAKLMEAYGFKLWVPDLEDLLATKVFALSSGKGKRIAKDLPDIAHLCLINNVDVKKVIKPLCDKYRAGKVYDDVILAMKEITDES